VEEKGGRKKKGRKDENIRYFRAVHIIRRGEGKKKGGRKRRISWSYHFFLPLMPQQDEGKRERGKGEMKRRREIFLISVGPQGGGEKEKAGTPL